MEFSEFEVHLRQGSACNDVYSKPVTPSCKASSLQMGCWYAASQIFLHGSEVIPPCVFRGPSMLLRLLLLPLVAQSSPAQLSAAADPSLEIQLRGTITPEKLSTHETQTFEMPKGIQRMEVELDSPGFQKGMYVTVGMWDPERYRGEGRAEVFDYNRHRNRSSICRARWFPVHGRCPSASTTLPPRRTVSTP